MGYRLQGHFTTPECPSGRHGHSLAEGQLGPQQRGLSRPPITSLPARFSGPHADLYGQCRVTALRGRSLSSFEGVRGPQVGDGVWKGSHRGELPGAGRCVSPRSPCGHRFSRLLPLGAHGEAGPGCWSPSSGSSCSDIWPVLGTEQKLNVPWRWAWPPCGSVALGELPNLSGSLYLENRRSGQD